jgi:hypothetical protein
MLQDGSYVHYGLSEWEWEGDNVEGNESDDKHKL